MTAARSGRLALLALALGLTLPSAASAAVNRTWVAGAFGDDANVSMDCSRVAPCATLAVALSDTTPGGEINALAPGDFGTVTIQQPVTIDLGGMGFVTNDGGGQTAITVDAGAADDVVLRGLSILGGGAACPYTGVTGIDVLGARSVTIADSQIAAQATGIHVGATASDPRVTLDGVAIRNACGSGLDVSPSDGHSAAVVVQDSTIAQTGTAVSALGNSHTWLFRSGITSNTVGIRSTGAAVIDTDAATYFASNGTDGTPAHVLNSGPAGVTGPSGATGDTGATGPKGPTGPTAFELTLPSKSLTAIVGTTVRVTYRTSASASATLRVIRGSKVVARVSAKAKRGGNSLRWNGRIHGKAAPAGRYRLRLTAVTAGGQKVTRTASLRVH